MVLIEIGAVLVCGRESPELMIELPGLRGIRRIVLRYRLHRPANRVTGDVFHHRVEGNLR